jgi:molybdenum cofactor synthesis domain-containing protein
LVPLVKEYTSVDDSIDQIRSTLHPSRKAESVPVLHAFGRVSAKDLVAPVDVPAVPASHMDGFAVISADLQESTTSGPTVLKVTGAVRPGRSPRRSVSHGEAVQVATGSQLPPGADAVVPTESVEVRGHSILVRFAPEPGNHVFRVGEDIRRGERVLSRGHTIRAQDLGLLLALGFSKVSVCSKPKISIIATGTELTPATGSKAGKVLDSHSPVFLRLCQALGCVGLGLGVVADNPRELAKALRKALAVSDFVLTLGGTSAGRHDLVVGTVAGLRPERIIHGIRMDRGRVSGIASAKGKPILMMPGPIQGAMNAFVLLGVPIIETLVGGAKSELEIQCSLGRAWEARKRFSDFRKVVYVKLKDRDGTVAEPLLAETESMKVLADADGYVVVPEGVKRMERGDPVKVRLLPGFFSPW